MQEGPEGLTGAHSSNSSEQEIARQRIRELIQEHKVLNDELKRLISEEGNLVAKSSAEEIAFAHMEQITKREFEIIDKQKEIIDEITRRL